MAGRGTSQNVQNDLLVQMVATLQQMNENLRSLNQNSAPSPSLQNLVPPGPTKYRGNGADLPAMNCSEAQKLAYATYMLVTEVENWWEFTRRQIEMEGQLISWSTFKAKFLHKYFPADLKRKKEMEFLKLELGNMSVGEYAAKFEELARFCPYSELEVDGRSKCSKFESGLRPKLKRMFRHQEIADFATLVNKCRMQGRGKERVGDDRKPYVSITIHRDRNFQRSGPLTVPTEGVSTPMCNKCGRLHYGSMFPGKGNGCFHYKEFGNIKRFCPKLDRRLNVIHAEEARDHGRKVTPSGAGTSGVDDSARCKLHGGSVDMRNDVPARFNPGNGLVDIGNARYSGGVPQLSALNVVPAKVFLFRELVYALSGRLSNLNGLNDRYQSWKSRLSERFSPERERLTWEGEIMNYTGGFSPERELSRLGEKWHFGDVETVRFSLERERQI
ncbi:hypothetical protein Lal_00000899 [Lupinus albus]|nr:hypothetical protein Lal_00000899 [Lupinus albus]